MSGTALPFTDVAEDAYYTDAVKWAAANGVTAGTSATTFSPNDTCTRAQAVTLLYNAAGAPAVSDTVSFADVAADAYYADAVAWAAANGVTAGTSATTSKSGSAHCECNGRWFFVQTACRLRITPEALLRAAARV